MCVCRPRAPARAASRAVRDDGAGPAWLVRLLAAHAVTQVTIEATGAEQVVHRVDQRRHQGGRGERAAPRCSRWVARRISSVVAQLPNSNRGHRSAGGVPSPASEGTQTSTRPPRSHNESPDYAWKPEECVRLDSKPCDRWRDRLVRLTRQRTSAWSPADPFLFVRPATSSIEKVLFAGILLLRQRATIGPRSETLRLVRQQKVQSCRQFERRERRDSNPRPPA